MRIFRYAPTPSRLLHVGNGLAAVLGWASARAAQGRFILRIEDIDLTRCKPEYTRACLDDLQWLGLDWDEGPYYQSERLALYDEALTRLADAGQTYACACSRAQIRALQRAPHLSPFFADAGKLRPYPGKCRTRELPGPPDGHGGWRLNVQAMGGAAVVTVGDRWQPTFDEDVRDTCGDFLLGRPGEPTYQLAAVVDDRAMGVSDVVRGHDLMGSTARQLLLHRALDAVEGAREEPVMAHHPLIVDERGRKLSKRDRALTLAGLRDDGVCPQTFTAWVCAAIGLVDPATVRRMSPRDVVDIMGESVQRWRDGTLPSCPPKA